MVQIEEMKDEVDQMLSNMRKRGGGGDSFQEQNPEEVDAFLSSVDRVSDLVAQLKTAGTDEELAKAKTDADQFVGQIKERTEKLKKKKNNGGGDDDDDDDGYETRVVASNKSSLNTNRTFHEAAPPTPQLPPGGAAAASQPNGAGANQEEMSQQAFMAAMEKDAEERYQRRLESAKISDEWKEKGNVEFK